MNKKTKNTKLTLPLYDAVRDFDTSLDNEQSGYETPSYIRKNMKHRFRYYQDAAFRFFHYTLHSEPLRYLQSRHVLFNMATGSGKTDLMAGLILYLYQEQGYQQFVFTVNTNSVLKKTIDNLTDSSSDKYLYQSPIEIDGNRIRIEKVNQFPMFPRQNVIYIKLDTIQGIASDIFTEKENTMGLREYERHKTAILADEAHHYSASTKKEKEEERSWERTIDLLLNANEDNRLLEFTATIDLDNKNIYAKYKDKVLYRYTLDRYIHDGYSKNIHRIQSSNTDRDNMMNVVLLSEFRRRYAEEFHGVQMKPVILFKSPQIKVSQEAEEKFNQMIDLLTTDSVEAFIRQRFNQDTEEYSETLYRTYNYYLSNLENLSEIVRDMKRQFAPSRIINANTTNMLENDQYEALNSLESPSNLYRAVFAVAKLTEGWDVLNLYDIVRISESPAAKGTKTSTNAEAQLVGRGARYYPFVLNGNQSYTRRFEDGGRDSLILETLHYHTINEPQYLKNLVASLDEMDLPTGDDQKNPPIEVNVKPSFKRTKIYQNGHIYYNEVIEVEDDYYDSLKKYGINNEDDIYIEWRLTTRELEYSSNFVNKDFENVRNIPVSLDKRLVLKAMNQNSFFHFERMRQYLPLLETREEFLGSQWLNLANRTLYATVPNTWERDSLTALDRLEIFAIYLKEVEQKIKSGYQKAKGTKTFIGYPVRDYVVDYQKRVPNYDTGRMTLSGTPAPQQVSRREYKDSKFFVYDSAIINQTEAQLIDRLSERIEELSEEYAEVYLLRMDENMHRNSPKGEDLKLHQFDSNASDLRYEGFQPDFILLLENEDYYLQIFIEPKGQNLIDKEQWKEDLLMTINALEGELIFEDEVSGIKVKGVKFYTMNDTRGTIKQIAEITLGNNFGGMSYKEENTHYKNV